MGEIIGLLTVHRPRQSKYAPSLDENLRLLSLVANLVGQPLFLSRHTAESPAAPEKPEARRIVGESAILKSALAQARRIAPTNLTVLLRGQSGSGKELFAQFIHDLSSRREKPFIKVNCAALPEGVLHRAHSPARAPRKARRYSSPRQSCAGAFQRGKRSRPDPAPQFVGAAVQMRFSRQCP